MTRGSFAKMAAKRISGNRKSADRLSKIENKRRRWHMSLPKEILSKLPIKTLSGQWIGKKENNPHLENDEMNNSSEGESDAFDHSIQSPPSNDQQDLDVKVAPIQKSDEDTIISIKEASKMLKESSPEENIKCLETIITSCNNESDQVRHLALLTALSVFKDIIPGYKIKNQSDEEEGKKSQVTLSKHIVNLRNFESFLLKYYNQYLSILEKYISNTSLKSSFEDKFIITCIVGNLILFEHHFNYFDRLLKLIMTCIYSNDEKIVTKSCDFIKELFDSDPHGEASMEMIIACSEAVQKRNYHKCPLQLLETIFRLRIKSEFSVHTQKTKLIRNTKDKGNHNLSKNQKKLQRKHKKQIEEVIETEAHHNSLKLQKWHEESLKHLLRIYFGILKSDDYSRQLMLVLKGVGRVMHLLNPAYYNDLLKTLKNIIEGKKLEFEVSIHSTMLIISILQMSLNSSSDLVIDYKFVHMHLFCLIKECSDWIKYISIIRNCIDGIGGATTERLCAFAQRLLDCALEYANMNNKHVCQLILQLLFHFIEKHSDKLPLLLISLIEDEIHGNDGFGMGIYNPKTDDPDLSFPFSRPLNGGLREIGNKMTTLKPLIDRIIKLGTIETHDNK